MHDVLGPGTRLGYCTNVHAGTTLESVEANLALHASAVREIVAPGDVLGVGLWLPASAARTLRTSGDAPRLRDRLAALGLEVFTINGFPYGDFHNDVVKHDVYRPDWTDDARLAYTCDLLHVLADLLPEGAEGSISTLPVGWGTDFLDEDSPAQAGHLLRRAAAEAARLGGERGVLLHVDIEPEPGCLLDRACDVVGFFGRHLLGGRDEDVVRRHVRVCHDVCHAAVMFEDQTEVLDRYAGAGIAVGKVQISSALRVPFDRMDDDGRSAAARDLAAFREPRYLHQTTVRPRAGTAARLHDDLPDAFASAGGPPTGEWRVHFHVPVFLERVGALETTRDEIAPCLAAARAMGVRHFEVETYAWDVLPEAHRTDDLAEGIARELAWVRTEAAS